MTTHAEQSNEFIEYHDQNANEVAALVEVGAMDPPTARLVINLLRERFDTLRHMSVTERVDLARDLAAIFGGSKLQ